MARIERLRKGFERLMEVVVLALMVTLSALIIVAVFYRRAGASLSWYDEVASVLLAWLTYYGSALAATKRAHIGFEGIVEAVPPRWGLTMLLIGEAVVIGFFAVLAWTGWEVLMILRGDTLVSLPQVPVMLTQSVIPIGAVLFIVGQLLSLPEYWRKVKAGESLNPEIQLDSLPEDEPGSVNGQGARPVAERERAQ
jgi:TRAP-type C4-dicarboxylate transport system permease small subunit